jgi:hypothetical protein
LTPSVRDAFGHLRTQLLRRRESLRIALVVSCAVATVANGSGARAQPNETEAQATPREGPLRVHEHGGPAACDHARPWSLFGGFTYVDFSHPGLHLGAEYALANTAHFQSFAGASFQAYRQPDTESGYALQIRWGHRYTAGFGFTFDHYLGLGVQYARYDTTVFEFRDSIASTKERTESRFAFAPQFVFGPGYDFERVLKVPLHFYARPGLMLVYPDLNDALQASLIAEFGLRWTPDL